MSKIIKRKLSFTQYLCKMIRNSEFQTEHVTKIEPQNLKQNKRQRNKPVILLFFFASCNYNVKLLNGVYMFSGTACLQWISWTAVVLQLQQHLWKLGLSFRFSSARIRLIFNLNYESNVLQSIGLAWILKICILGRDRVCVGQCVGEEGNTHK